MIQTDTLLQWKESIHLYPTPVVPMRKAILHSKK